MRRIMKKGKVQHALRELETLRVRSPNKCQAKHELITYLMNPAVGGTNAWIILAIALWGCPSAAARWRRSAKSWCKLDANPARRRDDGARRERSPAKRGTSALRPAGWKLRHPVGPPQRIHHRLEQTSPKTTAEESCLKHHSYVAPSSKNCVLAGERQIGYNKKDFDHGEGMETGSPFLRDGGRRTGERSEGIGWRKRDGGISSGLCRLFCWAPVRSRLAGPTL